MDLVKELEELSSEFGEDAVDRALLRYMHQRKKSEAIAALRPGGEREELAKHLEFIASAWRRDGKRPYLVPTADDLDKAAALLRAPVAVTVDDAMVERLAKFQYEEKFTDELWEDVSGIERDSWLESSRHALQAALAGEVK